MSLLTAGEKLGPYEILDPLGKGGMGEVWKARDTRLNRFVAIKKSQGQFNERFAREAQAIAAGRSCLQALQIGQEQQFPLADHVTIRVSRMLTNK